MDHDTLNQPGTPPVAETIFRKIRTAAVFLADVTFTSDLRTPSGQIVKRACNSNVMIELGYAVATLGWNRIILILNRHFGPPDDLPFDLRNHRFPITYDLGPNSHKDYSTKLTEELAIAVRSCLSAEYELVDSTLGKLSAFSRTLMKKYGLHQLFWETTDDNKVLTREDLAITQMLSAEVIQCVDAATDIGVGYAWTYLGQQCCLRLGAITPVLIQCETPASSVIVDDSMYEQLALAHAPTGSIMQAEPSRAPEPTTGSVANGKSLPPAG